MPRRDFVEAFAENVMGGIDTEVHRSMTPVQRSGVRQAIRSVFEAKQHGIDLRGAVPLFFVRFYFVLLMGRDSRFRAKELEADRRRRGGMLMGTVFVVMALSPLLLIAFVLLYLLKSVAGINLLPEWHLWELLGL